MNKLKTEKSHTPKVGFEFFCSDPCGDGLVYFKSEQERDDAVNEAIADGLFIKYVRKALKVGV